MPTAVPVVMSIPFSLPWIKRSDTSEVPLMKVKMNTLRRMEALVEVQGICPAPGDLTAKHQEQQKNVS